MSATLVDVKIEVASGDPVVFTVSTDRVECAVKALGESRVVLAYANGYPVAEILGVEHRLSGEGKAFTVRLAKEPDRKHGAICQDCIESAIAKVRQHFVGGRIGDHFGSSRSQDRLGI